MGSDESFRNKTFRIANADARLRKAVNLIAYAVYEAQDQIPAGSKIGDIKRIPMNTDVVVQEIKILATGSKSVTVFALALSVGDNAPYGWTSTRNFIGSFINETVGILKPESGAGPYSANAAWSGGKYLGQIDIIQIVSNTLEIERLSAATVEPFLAMVSAAAADTITISLNSGFRSYPEQKFLSLPVFYLHLFFQCQIYTHHHHM